MKAMTEHWRLVDDTRPVLVVTGADSGIGLAIARAFAEANYRVVLSGTSGKIGRQNSKGIVHAGGTAIYVEADVRSETAMRRLVRETIAQYGRIDVLCNNAGIQQIAILDEASAALWDEVMSINARGPFLGVKHALRHLRESKGCIVNIASIAGLVGYAGGTAYAASKAALVMMSKVWALELAPDGVRVNCICPGATRTPMIAVERLKGVSKQIPLGRINEPEDVAELALFLASPKARQITGGVFVVDGGITAGRPRLA